MVVAVGLLGAQMEMCKTRNGGFTEGMGARHDRGRGGAAALKSGQVGPLDLPGTETDGCCQRGRTHWEECGGLGEVEGEKRTRPQTQAADSDWILKLQEASKWAELS